MLRLILFGPPGAGKGTQAAHLCNEKNLAHVSTGDMLRSAIAEDTPLGQEAKKYMHKGDYVPDDIVIGIIRDHMTKPELTERGFILDGFPRTMPQAKALYEMLRELNMPLTHVILFKVDPEAVVRRIVSRRTCKGCKAIFSLNIQPPKQEGVCDHCGDELFQRVDDTREKVLHRLEVYEELTADTIEYYRDRGLVHEVSSMGTIEEVYQKLCTILENEGPEEGSDRVAG